VSVVTSAHLNTALEDAVITCSKCGRENEASFKFCLGCGGPVTAPAAPKSAADACPQCSTPITPGQKFCGSCGCKLEVAAAAPAPAPKVPAEPKAKPEPKPEPKPVPVKTEATAVKPAAAPAGAAAALTMVKPDGSPGESVALASGKNIVGRKSEHAVFSRDEFLSPEHASLEVNGKSVIVKDLGSLNGTYYRIAEVTELKTGDHVRLGLEVLRFQALASATAISAPAKDGTVAIGSPAGDAWGRLERISAPDEASFTFLLRSTEHFLGREKGDILFGDDRYVSGRHARIFTDGSAFFVEDLKSSNGTFVRLTASRELGHGALIFIGSQPFRLSIGG
jgi:pSer/pThr/pTyr-binding forkhead associated (FHA) protein